MIVISLLTINQNKFKIMKKLLLCAVVALFGITGLNAQGANAGVSVGFISGDFSDGYSFNITLDGNYLWEVSDQVEAGVATGYSHTLGKDVNGVKPDAVGFLPIAAAGRFSVSEDFTVGVDLGYAIGLSPDGNDGGFYYAPKVQYSVSESIDVVAAYRGVSLDFGGVTLGFNTITFGVEFGL